MGATSVGLVAPMVVVAAAVAPSAHAREQPLLSPLLSTAPMSQRGGDPTAPTGLNDARAGRARAVRAPPRPALVVRLGSGGAHEELITLRVFRTLPEWNETTNMGLTTYWLSEMIWINAPEPQRDKAPRLVKWWGKNLLDKPCTAWDHPGCAFEDIGWMVQSDLDCSGCKPSDVWITWQDYLPAYFPG